jgi:hypothetical protein
MVWNLSRLNSCPSRPTRFCRNRIVAAAAHCSAQSRDHLGVFAVEVGDDDRVHAGELAEEHLGRGLPAQALVDLRTLPRLDVTDQAKAVLRVGVDAVHQELRVTASADDDGLLAEERRAQRLHDRVADQPGYHDPAEGEPTADGCQVWRGCLEQQRGGPVGDPGGPRQGSGDQWQIVEQRQVEPGPSRPGHDGRQRVGHQ